MKQMIFSNDTAWTQLVEDGVVHTFRTQPREVPADVWIRRSRTGPKVAEAHIPMKWTVITADPTYLEPYAEKSGFTSVEKWHEAIHEVHGDVPYRGFVHRVELTKQCL